ncbi:MAG: thioredoxin domain-containing protein [Acidimicrobiia bacterium]
MIWIYLVIVLFVAIGIIKASNRNKSATKETTYIAPTKIERNDFPQCKSETLVVVFTSTKCDSCGNIIDKANVLSSDCVDVVNVSYEDKNGSKLQKKYEIEAVPTVVVCDENGVVQQSYIGSVSATDLWASVAKLRGADIATCQDH